MGEGRSQNITNHKPLHSICWITLVNTIIAMKDMHQNTHSHKMLKIKNLIEIKKKKKHIPSITKLNLWQKYYGFENNFYSECNIGKQAENNNRMSKLGTVSADTEIRMNHLCARFNKASL